MADGPARDERSQAPTQQRLDEARRQGDVPFSREPTQALVLLGAVAWTGIVASGGAWRFAERARGLIARAAEIDIDATHRPLHLMADAAAVAGLLVAPIFAIAILAPLLSALAQRSIVLTFAKLAPDLDRVNPAAGFGRLVSPRNLVEVLKSAFKVVAALVIAWFALRAVIEILPSSQGGLSGPAVMAGLVRRLLFQVAILAVVVAAVDVTWQQIAWRRRLMMTRTELRDELKSTEGNPEIKARLRKLQRERSRRRMLVDVPKAAVVITNPTHVAVALAYDGRADPVPRVLAKGRGALAQTIRRLAEDARVPIVTNPPVARLLEASVQIGETIRPEHYKAVAEVISYVLSRRSSGEIARSEANSRLDSREKINLNP